MREGWKYQKLGDVCDINYGTRVVQKKDKGSKYYVYGGGGATFMVDTFNREDCFVVSRFAMSPKCTRYVSGKFFLNDSGLSVSSRDSNLTQDFVNKALLANNDNIYNMGKGMAQRNLDIPSFRNLIIPVPPLPEQERIVSELDLLSGIIDKQKQQLKELDTLAQSVFYDMFGDPVTNDNGWEEAKISSVCDALFAGGDKPNDFSENKNEVYQYPIIGNGGGERGILGYSRNYRVDRAAVTIGARGASVGNCRICDPFFTPVVRLITMVPNGKVNIGYLYEVLKKMSFNVNGAGQAQLTTPNVANKLIPVPPLNLQQSFAQKIQTIEKQKESINKAIEETQKLFDYTMDKYFG